MNDRFLANENFPASLVRWLRDRGESVTHAATACTGATDQQLLELAQAESRVLLTFDRDFGDLVFRRRRPAPGIVLFRFDQLSREFAHHVIREFFEASPSLAGHFTVVPAGHFRQTRLPHDEAAGTAP